MKIDAVLLEQRHLDALVPRIQPRQRAALPALQNVADFGALMRRAGPCAAFVAGDEVVACAGLIDFDGTGRAVAWALFADGTRRVFAPLVRKICALRRFYPRRRYEAYIDPGWPQAQRLARLTGFSCEGLMKSFEPDGADRELWALIPKEAA